MTHKKKKIVRIAAFILIALIFLFMWEELASNREALVAYDWKFDYVISFYATLCGITTIFLVIVGWRMLLSNMGVNLRILDASNIYILSHVSRYIPGGFWSYFGRIFLLKKKGVTKQKAALSVLFEQVLSLIGGVIICYLSFAMWDDNSDKSFTWILWIIPVGTAIIYPPILQFGLNFFFSIFNRPSIRIEITTSQLFLALVVFIFAGFVNLLGNYLIFEALTDNEYLPISGFIAILALSQISGFLAVGVPGGIGVREGVLVALLSIYMPTYIAIVYSLASRIWLIAIDGLLMAGAAIAYNHKGLPEQH